MKTIIATFLILLIIAGIQAQDSCITKAAIFYVDSILPSLRPLMLIAEEELHTAAGRPGLPHINWTWQMFVLRCSKLIPLCISSGRNCPIGISPWI